MVARFRYLGSLVAADLGDQKVHVFLSRCSVVCFCERRWKSVQWLGGVFVGPTFRGSTLRSVSKEVCEVIKRRAVKVEGGDGSAEFDPDEFALHYTTLWEYLTLSRFEDGSPRKTSSLTVFADDGCLKAVLKDRDASLCLWAAAPSMTGLFTLLDSMLNNPETAWRRDKADAGNTQRVKGAKR